MAPSCHTGQIDEHGPLPAAKIAGKRDNSGAYSLYIEFRNRFTPGLS